MAQSLLGFILFISCERGNNRLLNTTMVRSNYCTQVNQQMEPHNRCLIPLHWLNTLLGRRIRVGNQVIEASDPNMQTRG